MATPVKKKLYTPEEYLALERASEKKHEYIDGEIYEKYEYVDGEIFLMSGASPRHCAIAANITGALVPQLRGTPCRVYAGDLKVRSGVFQSTRRRKGLFSYPDLSVVCGEPRFHDEARDVVVNPTVIFEILSPATESFDRGTKFFRYQLNDELADYVLIAQDEPRIEHFSKQADNRWLLTITHGLESEIHLPSINCALNLAEVFDRINFDDEDEAETDDER